MIKQLKNIGNWLAGNDTQPISQKSSDQPFYKVVPIPQGSFYDTIFNGGEISPAKAMEFYKETGVVATAVDMIGDEIANINPVLSQDGDLTDDSEIIEKLKKPNDFDTWSDYVENLGKNFLITGNMFNFVSGATKPIEIYSVEPALVSGSVDVVDGRASSYFVSTGTIAQGEYQRDTSNGVRFLNGNLKELSQSRAYTPTATNIMGTSLLNAVAKDVRQQVLTKGHNISLLEKGGRLSLAVITKDPAPDRDEMRKEKELVKEQYAGKAGEIAFFAGKDLEFKEMGLTSKDMDFAGLDQISSQALFLRYKIPLPLISLKATQFKNLVAGIETLYDRGVIPLANRIFEHLSYLLLPRYGLDTNKFKITYDPDQIMALRTRRLAEIADRRKINIETINELRKDMPGKEPVDDGDVIYQAANLQPLGVDILADDDPEAQAQQLIARDS